MKTTRDLAILSLLILSLAVALAAPLLAKPKPIVTEVATGPGCTTSTYGGGYCTTVIALAHPLKNDNFSVKCTGAGTEITLAQPVSRQAILIVMRDLGLLPGPGFNDAQATIDSAPRFVSYPTTLTCAVTYKK
jgi:hypothetical protein